jgi:hypothetical protein
MSTEPIVSGESSPPPMPRHWRFAAALAWEGAYHLLEYGNASAPLALLLQQLVADFLADPIIQDNDHQHAIWTLLRDQINANLADELRDPPTAVSA